MQQVQSVEPGDDPNPALAAFDLSVAEVHERIVRPAIIAVEDVNPLSPLSAPGTRMNDEMVARLRGVLLPKYGWELDKLNDGVSRSVNLDHRIAIVPATGNEGTGHFQRGLTTKNPKGSAAFTAALKFESAGFEAIDPSGYDWKVRATNDNVQWKLWYLLHRRQGNKVYLELSAPDHLDDSGFPRGWRTRISIPTFEIGEPDIDVFDGNDDGDPDIDVPVRKK
ncbi:hypothetical protein [Williamsia muralis]|uniref:hypothetical protein n=1 Tax=Williamsia marianensis TaxID=85044 RepID=UPI00382E3ABD